MNFASEGDALSLLHGSANMRGMFKSTTGPKALASPATSAAKAASVAAKTPYPINHLWAHVRRHGVRQSPKPNREVLSALRRAKLACYLEMGAMDEPIPLDDEFVT